MKWSKLFNRKEEMTQNEKLIQEERILITKIKSLQKQKSKLLQSSFEHRTEVTFIDGELIKLKNQLSRIRAKAEGEVVKDFEQDITGSDDIMQMIKEGAKVNASAESVQKNMAYQSAVLESINLDHAHVLSSISTFLPDYENLFAQETENTILDQDSLLVKDHRPREGVLKENL